MSEKKGTTSKSTEDVYETDYRRRKIRIVEPVLDRRGKAESSESKLYIDDEEIPIEVTETGVFSHEMAFKEYGSIEELAEDIIRQRGTAQIVKGDHPHHGHSGDDHPH